MRLVTVAACAFAILLAAGAGAATTQFDALSPGSVGPLARLLVGCDEPSVLASFDVIDDLDLATLFETDPLP